MTLEELYIGDDRGPFAEYHAAREAKVAEILDYIASFLKPGIDAERYAEALMSNAEEMGRIYNNSISVEIAARYSRSGDPVSFQI